MNILEAIDRLQGVREGLVVLGDHDDLREFSGFIGLLIREIDGVIGEVREVSNGNNSIDILEKCVVE